MNNRIAIAGAIFAAIVAAAGCAHADSPGYGFTAPPYDYND
jgi:hypothetical protein